MAEKPILFSTPMVKAILEGRKTQTRRVMKMERDNDYFAGFSNDPDTSWPSDYGFGALMGRMYFDNEAIKCPWQVGDHLWVRETFRRYYVTKPDSDEIDYEHLITEYAADGGEMIPMMDGDGFHMFNKDGSEKFIPWKPSIHMPKSAARIWLEVTDIRVERLQEIEPSDAVAEGVTEPLEFSGYIRNGIHIDGMHTEIFLFKELWESINGPDSWDQNPWVFVISFKTINNAH